MKDTIKTFNVCICDMQKTRGFYVFLRDHYKIAPAELTDLLRSELVNLVSAMDRFIHEFVRIGIINSYTSQLVLIVRKTYRQVQRAFFWSSVERSNGYTLK